MKKKERERERILKMKIILQTYVPFVPTMPAKFLFIKKA